MRLEIVELQRAGLILRTRFRRRWTIAYGEIRTAERLTSGRGLRLHTVTSEPIKLAVRPLDLGRIEQELRRRGVRIVDCWGAIIAPTLQDFEAELARGPGSMRQSSDNA